jgi:putative transposase
MISGTRAALRQKFHLSACPNLASHLFINDKLASYRAAKKEVMPGVARPQHKGLNNRPRIRISRRDDESDR